MPQSSLRKAVRFALESILNSTKDRDAALSAAESEIAQMLHSSDQTADTATILAVLHEEIVRAKAIKH